MNIKIVVLSLDSATRRREQFAATARDADFDWSFFNAHRSLSPDLSYEANDALRYVGRELSAGELGCYSSHMAIWRSLINSDGDGVIVLEDDVIADWSFLAAMLRDAESLKGIDYLRLYYKNPCPYALRQRNFVRRSTSIVELFGFAFGTQGYYIDRRAAERFLAGFRRVRRPIDNQLDRFWEHGVPNLCVFPFPLLERLQESDIGDHRFHPDQGGFARKAWLFEDRIARKLAIARRRLSSSFRAIAR